MKTIDQLRSEIMNATENKAFTEKGWVPIFMAEPNARILIVGQAPGAKTQEAKGVFYDQSGVRLRRWLGVDEDTFYKSGKISVLPMDFYFPGNGKQGDLPPRKDFYKKWHPQFLEIMPELKLILLVGMYAQKAYLVEGSHKTITENVLNYREYLPLYFPLIHPSPRNQVWISKHPEFERDIVPVLQSLVKEILEK